MTFLAQTGDSRVYGGVELSTFLQQRCLKTEGALSKVLLALLCLDLPLTAVADAALLPATLPAQLLERRPSEIPWDEDDLVVVKSRLLLRGWIWWAHHYWIEIKDGDESRWESVSDFLPSVLHIDFRPIEAGRARRDHVGPHDDMTARDSFQRIRVHAVITGEEARRIIARLREIAPAYRQRDRRYRVWPGPNSNTFAADMAREAPELRFDMDHNAAGKDFTPFAHAGLTTTKTGVALDTLPLGVAAGLRDGIELHCFQLTLGASLFPPAVKLPFLQRLGFPAITSRRS